MSLLWPYHSKYSAERRKLREKFKYFSSCAGGFVPVQYSAASRTSEDSHSLTLVIREMQSTYSAQVRYLSQFGEFSPTLATLGLSQRTVRAGPSSASPEIK
jgi:hypothetical protein